MIVVLAGDAALGAQVGKAIARRLAQTAVLQPDYFAPIGNQVTDSSRGEEGSSGVPWLAESMAASAERIAAHGGTSVVVLPNLEDVSSLLTAFNQMAALLYLFLLQKPTRPQGIFRRAVIVDAKDDEAEVIAESIVAHTVAGKGLIRPAPSGTGEASLLPAEGGPSTGVDIVEIPRIARIVERYGERFLQRVYTEAEQALYRGRVPELAARFAAKEAVSKALGTGIWGIRWREMEILPDVRGKPLVYLHGAAAARARALNLRYFAVSLSHSRDLAMAVVVAT